jgi:hypothetical protein
MYEHHRQPLVSRKVFYQRIVYNILLAAVLMLITLLIGVAGYHYWGEMTWINSIHNAAMILAGMGLIDPIHSDSGKIFSSAYAIFSGIIFITNFGIILTPALHRILHKLHVQDK